MSSLRPSLKAFGSGLSSKGSQEKRMKIAVIGTGYVGLVAGTNHDSNNLSIVMTAGELNGDLYRVARQNRLRNEEIFEAADLDEARRLFRAYAAWLQAEVCLADFEAELAGLPGDYAAPAGGIWLAGNHRTALGVVALRPLAEPAACEMKRLWVAPEGRGQGLGKGLLRACIEGARTRR